MDTSTSTSSTSASRTNESVGVSRASWTRYVQFEPRRAFRAARILGEDPDDLPQVFTIIEAFSVDTLARVAKRLERTERGRRLLSEKPDIVNLLADREALARLPEGSLGRAYLDFVEKEKISADGIRAASTTGMQHESDIPAPLDWVQARLRDTHDLWHAVTGYSGDVLGESALLAFSLTQTWNPGIALILAVAVLKTLQGRFLDGRETRRTIYDGFKRGLRAGYFVDQDWESLLALPVEEVRRRLRVDAPPIYREVRSWELKAAKQAVA